MATIKTILKAVVAGAAVALAFGFLMAANAFGAIAAGFLLQSPGSTAWTMTAAASVLMFILLLCYVVYDMTRPKTDR